MQYERDRAARDIGLHFTQTNLNGTKIVTTALAWFQLKGIRRSKLSAHQFSKIENISLSVEVKHLKFWFSLPVPTYLVVYIEALDKFFIVNVTRWINETFGESILSENAQTKTIHIRKNQILDDSAFVKIRDTSSLDSIKKHIGGTSREALIFLRDAQIIKAVATTGIRGVQQRIRYISWISKMRSEVYFEEASLDKENWEKFRSHWQYAMGDLDGAFPYLEFEAFDEEHEWDNVWDQDEISPEDVHIIGGKKFVGEGGWSGEYSELILRPLLNNLGEVWARMLDILENADLLVVNSEPKWISIAPWNDVGL